MIARLVRLSIAALCLFAFASSAAAQANGHLQIHFMDVGQGDGALLITPGGETVLFDNGALNSCERPVAYLQRLGVRQIDYHIASHYHADHIGCTAEVLTNFPLARVAYDRGGSYSSQTYSRYVATVGARRQTAPVGSSLSLEGGVALDFVAANGAGVAGADDENDLSVVMRVRYGNFEAVIGGDLSGVSGSGYRDVESTVAQRVGQVEVYKVNHHASRYSSNTQWLSTLRPKIGIVSVGASNSYGHPTIDAMARLHQAGVKTYWTSAGRGAAADAAWDFVGGDTVVDVPPGGGVFTVRAAGQTHAYSAWGSEGAPPGAPLALTGTVSGNIVTLNWSPPTTGGVPTSYLLEASVAAGGPALTTINVPGTSLTVPSVPNGTYYVRVRGVSADGTSSPSNEVTLAVPSGGSGGGGGCVAAPGAPTLTGNASGALVSLTWTQSASGCAATGFTVHAGSSPGLSNVTQAHVGANTSLSANAPAGTYYVRVLASNAYGSSAPSNEVVVTVGSTSPTPPPPCSLPGAPMLMAPSVIGSTVSLSWVGGSGATSYRVLAGSLPGATDRLNAVAGSTTYQWTGAPAGTHYVRIIAINSCGQSAASNEVATSVTGTPAPSPTSPTCNGGAVPSSASCGRPTAQCRDGSWSCSQNRSGTCSSHGGVSCWVCPGPLC